MFIDIHSDRFIVKNLSTGKEYEFSDIDEAEKFAIDKREERQDAEWELYAVINF